MRGLLFDHLCAATCWGSGMGAVSFCCFAAIWLDLLFSPRDDFIVLVEDILGSDIKSYTWLIVSNGSSDLT